MNYEHVKTGLLMGLIGLSIILTWQLWTFQPDIALLEETETIASELGEERRLTEVIKPEQVVVHHSNEEFKIMPKSHPRFEDLYEDLLESRMEEPVLLANGSFPNNSNQPGIEIIFPTAIPVDTLLNLMQIDRDKFSLPVSDVSRLYLYKDPSKEDLYIQLLSPTDQLVVEVETDISVQQFNEVFFESEQEYVDATPLNAGSTMASVLKEAIYLPNDHVKSERISYTTTPLSGEFFMQILFSDPSSVKHYHQPDGEEFFTDGNRIINIRNNGDFMDYSNPLLSDNREKSSKHIIQSSFEFINGHGGWTDPYVLFNWSSYESRDDVEYRHQIKGTPVISFEGRDLMGLRVSRSGNQTISYVRPLFDLDQYPIDAVERVELPSGQELVERLSEQEHFSLRNLEKAVIGYEMTRRNPTFVSVEPHWFVLYDGRWQKVTFNQQEEELDELE
ncbi:YycH family regulatory protein [Bacillus solitudinis]|uniref:YycH family regulatory protein n=1 Tax=Bacillus solitudinis TaxID=2014074 RepID=UPI000C245E88|nr:two-component system activity regulator YycH [Bacillus solitudinis]